MFPSSGKPRFDFDHYSTEGAGMMRGGSVPSAFFLKIRRSSSGKFRFSIRFPFYFPKISDFFRN
jgi:hypothetical protein